MMTTTRLIILVLALTVGTVRAAPLIDQAQEIGDVPYSFGNIDFHEFAQTFSVGRSGWLTAIDLQVAESPFFPEQGGNLVVNILPTLDGKPTSPVLLFQVGKDVIPTWNGQTPADVDFLHIELPTRVPVTAGKLFAIELFHTGFGSGEFVWGGSEADVYGGGQAFSRGFAELWGEEEHDFAFRTHVDPVPEPATWVLLASGIGILWRRLT